MPLRVGIRLGHYDITAKIGEGGMGEVYRARDTKLDRDVALKVLPEAFTSDSERLSRFQCSVVVGGGLNRRTDLTDRQKRQSDVCNESRIQGTSTRGLVAVLHVE